MVGGGLSKRGPGAAGADLTRPRLCVRGAASRVRAGGVRRSGVHLRGEGARTARARARDAARVRHRPATRDARSHRRAVHPQAAGGARAAGPRRPAPGAVPAAVAGGSGRPCGGQRERRAGQALQQRRRRAGERGAASGGTGRTRCPGGARRRDVPGAATLHSVPEWLAERWFEELGGEQARALLAHSNLPAESALRVNTLVIDPDELRARLPVPARAASGLREGIVLEAPFDPQASTLWEAGAIIPQARGSMLVSRVLDPGPGERVLDLCAAPGGKTTHLAALMGGAGEVVAVERHPGRARALVRDLRADARRVGAGTGRRRGAGALHATLRQGTGRPPV